MQKIEMRADHPDFSRDAVPDERFKDVLLPVAGGHKPLYDCTRIDLDGGDRGPTGEVHTRRAGRVQALSVRGKQLTLSRGGGTKQRVSVSPPRLPI